MGRIVAISGRCFSQRIVAMRFPPKEGRVACIMRVLGSILISVASAVMPVWAELQRPKLESGAERTLALECELNIALPTSYGGRPIAEALRRYTARLDRVYYDATTEAWAPLANNEELKAAVFPEKNKLVMKKDIKIAMERKAQMVLFGKASKLEFEEEHNNET